MPWPIFEPGLRSTWTLKQPVDWSSSLYPVASIRFVSKSSRSVRIVARLPGASTPRNRILGRVIPGGRGVLWRGRHPPSMSNWAWSTSVLETPPRHQRRRSKRGQPVFFLDGCSRSRYRHGALVFPGNAPRPLGLRQHDDDCVVPRPQRGPDHPGARPLQQERELLYFGSAKRPPSVPGERGQGSNQPRLATPLANPAGLLG